MEKTGAKQRLLIGLMALRVMRRLGGAGILYMLLDILTLLCSLGFALAIGAYFGYQPFEQLDVLQAITNKKLFFLILAFCLSISTIAATFVQSLLLARITVTQEFWYAGRFRKIKTTDASNTVIARASNHYGRFSAASVSMISSIFVIVISVAAAGFFLSLKVYGWLIFTLILAVVLLMVAFSGLGSMMGRSSHDLAEFGRHAALWKAGIVSGTGTVRSYARAYFRRILLAGVFGLAPLVFVAIVTLILIVLDLQGVELDLAPLFAAFIAARMYLGFAGRAFNQAMRLSAYAQAVVKVWTTLQPLDRSGSARTQQRSVTDPPAHDEDPDLE